VAANTCSQFDRQAFEEGPALIEVFTPTERDQILAEAEAWAQENEATDFADEAHEATESVARNLV